MKTRDGVISWSLFGGALLGAVLAASTAAAADPTLDRDSLDRDSLDRAFQQKLATLAAKCDELGLPEQARVTRDWFVARDPRRQYFFLPADSDATRPPANASNLIRQWHDRWRRDRNEQADALFGLAEQAVAGSKPDVAYRLLYEVLRENPDHAQARRILGFVRSGQEWRSGPREKLPTAPKFDHPQLGWRRGQYWRLETEHFRVASDLGAKAAIDLGRQLEDLHAVWRQMFFRFWCSGPTLAARFQGGADPLIRPRQHDVVLFRDRADYVASLGRVLPRVELTLGMYSDQQRTSYFYAGDQPARTTWLHEATHQLFQETVDLPAGVAAQSNIWAVEGVALYLESLLVGDGYATVGGVDADRLQFARYRTLRGDSYLPLEKLVAFGRQSLQEDKEIRRLYGQAAGLTHFFLDGDGGRLREAFLDYLIAIYLGRDRPESLARLAGAELVELDRRYHAFLKNVTDDDLRRFALPPTARNLSLGQTAVTDAGLKQLKGGKSLEWLDLSFTTAGDSGLASLGILGPASPLRQLFLERTAVSDASLTAIGELRRLEELDLSGTSVSDAGLARLSGCKTLRKLYLTDCPISDAGLASLAGLRQLEELETSGTRVTAEGRKQLRRQLPKLAE